MNKIFIPLFLIIFFLCNSSIAFAGTDYFIHVEIGYKKSYPTEFCPGRNTDPTFCAPDPEWSNPKNIDNLKKIEDQINLGVEEDALKYVVDTLKNFRCEHTFCNGDVKVGGLFLIWPFYAENHPKILNYILGNDFTIGIHMHENWSIIVKDYSPDELRNYLYQQKQELTNAIKSATGRDYTVTIFSYGPGIELDNVDKGKLFKAVKEAGYEKIQTLDEKHAIDASLIPIPNKFGLAHSSELHTRYGLLDSSSLEGLVLNKIKDKCGCKNEYRNGVGFDDKCHVECDSGSECNNKYIGTSLVEGGVRKVCNSTCQYYETFLGDINLDKSVNIKDIFIVAKAFGSSPENSRWNQVADIDGNGEINIQDIFIVAKDFGKTRK